MFSNYFFTISDFARLMGVSRQALIYYDRIGLFKPIKTLDNKYRLYSKSQIHVLSLISMLGEMGVPLKEIKTLVERISPDTAIELLEKQRKEAEEKLRRYQMLEAMIRLRIEQIMFGKKVLEKAVPSFSVVEIEKEIPLYLGEAVNCVWSEITDHFIVDFYSKCEDLDFPLIFSGGQMKSRENIMAGRTDIVSNMCFRLTDPTSANAVIPKGRYAVGYVRGEYENTDALYRHLLSFLAESGMKIAGNAYEEYLLDELAESDPNQFVMRVMIQAE